MWPLWMSITKAKIVALAQSEKTLPDTNWGGKETKNAWGVPLSPCVTMFLPPSFYRS